MRNPGHRSTLFLLFGLLVVAPLQEAFGYAIDLFQQSTQERRGAGSGTGGEDDVRTLEPGKPHRRGLAGGQRHTYRIKLAADQFLKAVIEQDGIDVVARLVGPDGKQIMEFDSESRLRGRETVEQVAKSEQLERISIGCTGRRGTVPGAVATGSMAPGRYRSRYRTAP